MHGQNHIKFETVVLDCTITYIL